MKVDLVSEFPEIFVCKSRVDLKHGKDNGPGKR